MVTDMHTNHHPPTILILFYRKVWYTESDFTTLMLHKRHHKTSVSNSNKHAFVHSSGAAGSWLGDFAYFGWFCPHICIICDIY